MMTFLHTAPRFTPFCTQQNLCTSGYLLPSGVQIRKTKKGLGPGDTYVVGIGDSYLRVWGRRSEALANAKRVALRAELAALSVMWLLSL